MDLSWIWKAVLMVLVGTFLLRMAGRKSISQMTLAQTVIMIGIGSLLIQPIAGKDIWATFTVGGVLVLTLIVMEYGQVKSDWIESLITGKAKILIKNGTIMQKNLRQLRFTVDQLEMKLRQQNVSKLSDVDWATLEPNGQLGFTLKQEAQPATQKQIEQLTNEIKQISLALNSLISNNPQQTSLTQQSASQLNSQKTPNNNQTNLFTEVANNSHENNPPKQLH